MGQKRGYNIKKIGFKVTLYFLAGRFMNSQMISTFIRAGKELL